MTKEQQQIEDFMLQAKQEIPKYPVIPNEKIRRLRLNLIGEEFIELANALGFCCNFDYTDMDSRPEWLNLTQTADAIADILYVVIGTAVSCGIDIDKIFQEVHRSNMTKFIDGTFREDGKYIKGQNYSPPNIGPLLAKQLEQYIKNSVENPA